MIDLVEVLAPVIRAAVLQGDDEGWLRGGATNRIVDTIIAVLLDSERVHRALVIPEGFRIEINVVPNV